MTAIVLVKNEEKNLPNCLDSIKGLVKRIVVVDSGSTDSSKEIALSYGAEVYEHEWIHYAAQFNWAIDNIPIDTKWIYRIDADEVVTPELACEIEQACEEHAEDNVNGLVMKFKIFFMGRFLTHGGVYPFYNLTIFKNGFGRYEDRAMGEHIVLSEGRSVNLEHDCLHYDFKDLSSWTIKHNNYSTREVTDYFYVRENNPELATLYGEAERTKSLRDNLYYKLPLFLRAHLYFIYRYYFRFGFLDGKPGKMYAFLQAYWYRFLVDAKIYEKELNGQNPNDK
ncbi:glycosyltransferase family 2 protein [Olsenella profusa]|uniref:Glycosyltransferase family 2 protein n=1 Tax=Olsenella profusa TaxID=138595 RepID=A0ABS2F1R5_9ACTN|nr:glycosyltransferase family 2 protein [Olsenella profusa]MBM6774921.1 glycosyltransferase family 2 protein [Olsenella profusa]